MRLTANNLAMIAAVALAPTIVTPAASATVGISRPTTQQARSMHIQCAVRHAARSERREGLGQRAPSAGS